MLGLAALREVVRAYRMERHCFIAARRAPAKSVSEFGIPGLKAVEFRSRAGDRIAGVYGSPKNGNTVVLTHGSGGERSDVAGETAVLAAAGFGVLAFDWPGHGESDGVIEWGAPERAALAGALDFLEKQPGSFPKSFGALGFSMGGYIVCQVAATDTRIAAVVLSATPHDPIEHTRWEYRRLGPLTQWPALLALRVSGFAPNGLTPERLVGRIAPRPLLIVRGDKDESVPLWMSERLAQAAREPKRLLVVPNAGHGGFLEADPGYARELVGFFEKLGDKRAR
jgi:pimeloyl-ACP methyl ester carboxylesterase